MCRHRGCDGGAVSGGTQLLVSSRLLIAAESAKRLEIRKRIEVARGDELFVSSLFGHAGGYLLSISELPTCSTTTTNGQ